MTPAELARDNAISFECKKDALQQRQSGDWKISFTVQGVDMDERITRAAMGTRFVAVLVELNDDESPVQAKEKAAKPRPDIPTAGARREWRNVPPTEQAGIRCGEATFRAFLYEEHGFDVHSATEAAVVVRQLCRVGSRKEFNAIPAAKERWMSLNDRYEAWERL